jgi:hypothetical protein
MVFGFEYRSSATFAGWPLLHICTGIDPLTMRPKVARGLIAIGHIAIGGIAVAGVAIGFVSLGGLSLGLFAAVGGAALGTGLSVGGVAVGQIAFGGVALGFRYAMGGLSVAPAVIDADSCDAAAREFFGQWQNGALLPPHCER